MNATNAIVEIDKAGRIVIPKKMRDAMELTPGTLAADRTRPTNLRAGTDSPEPRLERRMDSWCWSSGPPLSGEDVNQSIEDERERRMRYVAGLSDEP